MEDVFRALADPTRRDLLDSLFAQDGQTLLALTAGRGMTRIAVAKHLAILEEAERGEDHALESYRDALKEPLPEPVRSVVQMQYEDAKRNNDEVRRLRDEARAVNA